MENNIYQRYVISEVARAQMLCLGSLTFIIWFLQVLKLLFLFDKQVSILQFLNLVTLVLPSLIHIILPFATLYACIYFFNHIKQSREIIVLENAGFSPRDLLSPIVKLGLFTTFIGLINASYFMPYTYGSMKEKLAYYRSNYTSYSLHPGMFNKVSKNIVLYVHTKDANNKLGNIILFDLRNSEKPALFLANTAKINYTKNYIMFGLENGQRQSISDKGSYEFISFDNFQVKIDNTKFLNREGSKDLQEYYLNELLWPSTTNHKMRSKLFAEGNNRLIWPFFSLLIPALAVLLLLRAECNRKEYSKHLIYACTVPLCFVFFHYMALNFASSNSRMLYLVYANILVLYAVFRLIIKKG